MSRFLLSALLCLIATAEIHAMPSGLYLDVIASRYSVAEKKIEDAYKNPDEMSGSDLAVMCHIYFKLKRYGKLAKCTDRLEARIKAGEVRHSDFLVLASSTTPLPDTLRAGAAFELGDPTQALMLARKAYPLITEEGTLGIFSPASYKIELLQIMGIAATLTGRRAEAEKYMALLETVDVPHGHGQQWKNLKDVALIKLSLALGQHEKALEYLSKGERNTMSRMLGDALLLGGDSMSTAYDLPKFLMQGKALIETGKFDEAKKAISAMLNHKRVAEYPDLLWVALEIRGRLAEKERDGGGAIDFYRKAVDIIEQQRSTINTEASKIGFVGDKQAVYGRLIAVLIEQGRANEAFDYV
ncbi:MAG: hypothetical protein OEL86_19475, partial [Sulfuritalea sp.]|nr:hypothetical protein [Sulfuritalea sp.]